MNFLKYELLMQNKIQNLLKYFLIFFVFCSISITMVNNYDNIQQFGVIFCLIAIPLAFLGISSNFLKTEMEDGSLELFIVSFNPIKIIITKYIALNILAIIAFSANIFLSWLLFDIYLSKLILIAICGLLLIILSSAMIILISAIQCYFRANTNFLSILIMPLIIPSIILCGMIIQSNNSSLALILLGMNLIIAPISIYLSSYLIANIYNI